MKQLKDLNVKWYIDLQKTCKEAFTYINEFEQSIDSYRKWIIEQNDEIAQRYQKNIKLINDNTRLKLELEDVKGTLIHTESYINEIQSDSNNKLGS